MPPAATAPPSVKVAAALLAVEGFAAAVFAVVEIAQTRAERLVLGVGVTVVMLGFAALLLASARAALRGRRWSRSPAVAMQLILLPVAWSFRQPPTTWVGFVLFAVALVTLVGLLHPRSTAWLTRSTVEEDAE